MRYTARMPFARRRSVVGLCTLGASVVFISACVFVQDLGTTDGEATSGDAAGDVASPTDGHVRSDGGGHFDAGIGKDAAAQRDGSTPLDPLGALPSGYCCTSDDQCRYRHCVESANGQHMCVDECSPARAFVCTRPDIDFTCVASETSYRCAPPNDFECLDPSTYVHGTRKTGACCDVSDDGLMGHACEANMCIATGNNPWVCTRRCDSGADCPNTFQCASVGDRKECVPSISPYTCQ